MSSTPVSHNDASGIGGFLAKRWFSLLIAVLAIIFIAQNRNETTIELFWAKVSAPLWVVLASLFVAGWLAGIVRTRAKAKRKAG